jgi:hypothetical protein
MIITIGIIITAILITVTLLIIFVLKPKKELLEYTTLPFTFDQPVFITGDHENSLYVVEEEGIIYKIMNNEKQVWLDLSQDINSNGFEQGLFSMVFEPNSFVFYIMMTDINNNILVRKYTNSIFEVVLSIPNPSLVNSGGCMVFNEYLFVSVPGKILRINNTTFESETYVDGLINPWRFSFNDNKLWIGNITPDQDNIIVVHDKNNSEIYYSKHNSALVGGYVFNNKYFYSDFIFGNVFYLDENNNEIIIYEFDAISSLGKINEQLYACEYHTGKIHLLQVL